MSNWSQSLDRVPTGSLLVSTRNRQIIRFHCPIKASCRVAIAGYQPGDTVFIDGVYENTDFSLLYLIDGLQLPHHYFTIQP